MTTKQYLQHNRKDHHIEYLHRINRHHIWENFITAFTHKQHLSGLNPFEIRHEYFGCFIQCRQCHKTRLFNTTDINVTNERLSSYQIRYQNDVSINQSHVILHFPNLRLFIGRLFTSMIW